jgi:hypothetical protein
VSVRKHQILVIARSVLGDEAISAVTFGGLQTEKLASAKFAFRMLKVTPQKSISQPALIIT